MDACWGGSAILSRCVSKDLGQTLKLEYLFQEVQASNERLRQGKFALESFGKLSINILKVDSIAWNPGFDQNFKG